MRRLAILLTVLALGACAGSTGSGLSFKEEMREGVTAATRGYWQEALFRFERARAIAPDDARMLNNLAVALEALGRYDDALATYKKAVSLDPKDTTVKRNYARFAEFYTSYAKGVKAKEKKDAGP
jgi:Flp pilus assembly protein TadD